MNSESKVLPKDRGNPGAMGQMLLTNKLAQAGELLITLGIPIALIFGSSQLIGDNSLALHGIISGAILLMISLIWLGLRLRGQNWSHLGLTFARVNWRTASRCVLLSLAVFVFAVAAFVMGSIVLANIGGAPQGADTSGYHHLKGNLPMVLLTLLAVYVTASFGEELIYRGFLITRLAELGSGSKAAWGAAVVTSSVVFGLIHYQWGLAGMIQTGFMGLALGVSYLRVQRNLWVTVLAHGYMDTILILQMY